MMKQVLSGPIGMKTLDPMDKHYRGYYDNGNDSEDYSVAHGFNYHQGPEWVWVYGTFLKCFWNEFKHQEKSRFEIQKCIYAHKLLIKTNKFAGLPELTNQEGAFCYGSCPTQTWSSAVFLELLQDMKK